jgi:hypothetical protein
MTTEPVADPQRNQCDAHASIDTPIVLRDARTMAQPRLSIAARAFRGLHGLIAVVFLLAIAYVWWCALTGRRDRWLRAAVAALVTEGVSVTANRGDCPLGGLQDRLGDPVPLFELVLSPPAARRAVPVLGAVTAAGIGLLLRRAPSRITETPVTSDPGPTTSTPAR